MDSDGLHPVLILPQFPDYVSNPRAELVFGARVNRSKMPLDRRFSNWLSTLILQAVSNTNLINSQSGNLHVPTTMKYHWRESGFAFESEMLLRFALDRNRITFNPIPTLYMKNGVSSLNRVKDTLHFIRMVFRTVADS